nr:phosphatidylinositol-glycan biosynthesis class X protein-like [Lytechinus pictus]
MTKLKFFLRFASQGAIPLLVLFLRSIEDIKLFSFMVIVSNHKWRCHFPSGSEAVGSSRLRTVHTNVSVVFMFPCNQCRFVILEHLPTGMFVDAYQLKNLKGFGAPAVLFLGEIDVEKPEHLSPNHTIAIYTPPIKPANNDNHMISHMTASIDLPVHLRYHAPSSDPEVNHAEVYLPHPELFMYCTGCSLDACSNDTGLMRAPCTAANHSICSWTPLDYTMDTYEELVFRMPVGKEWQSRAVTIITLTTIIVGMIVLLVAMTTNKKTQRMKKR